MNDFQILLKNKKVITGFIIAAASLIFLTLLIGLIDFSEVNRKDYSKVGEVFLKESGFIANKIGKVTRISHIGKGGKSGGKSYNVYKVWGEETTGVCNLTIERDSVGDWYVTEAEIAFDNKNLTVPVKRSEGEKVKKFNLQ